MQDIQLNRTQPTEISFEMELDGLPLRGQSDIDVRFVVDCGSHLTSVRATHNIENLYNVLLPALSFLSKDVTGCQYHIEVIAQGYHFEPMTGTAELVDSINVKHITTPKVAMTSTQPEELEQSEPVEDEVQDLETTHSNVDVVDPTVPKPEEIPFAFDKNSREFNHVNLDNLSNYEDEEIPSEKEPEPEETEGEPTEPKVTEPEEKAEEKKAPVEKPKHPPVDKTKKAREILQKIEDEKKRKREQQIAEIVEQERIRAAKEEKVKQVIAAQKEKQKH